MMQVLCAFITSSFINPSNAELNPICYLLALLGAHHFLHVSRVRVKSLTLRQLMSYIYINIYIYIYIYIYNISCQRSIRAPTVVGASRLRVKCQYAETMPSV